MNFQPLTILVGRRACDRKKATTDLQQGAKNHTARGSDKMALDFFAGCLGGMCVIGVKNIKTGQKGNEPEIKHIIFIH